MSRISGVLLCLAMFCGTGAWAYPALQLYAEGATYNAEEQTWEAKFPESGSIRLWTIGDVGAYGTISNVKLSIAYSIDRAPEFTLNPSTTGGYGGVADPEAPSAPTLLQTNTSGDAPLLSGGKELPSHGIYGPGTAWQEFLLGDFDKVDSPIGDFTEVFPSALVPDRSQINVYEISQDMTQAGRFRDGDVIHFDLYDSIQAQNKAKAKFAPFSHDAEGTGDGGGGGGGSGGVVPEPASIVLLGSGLLGIGAWVRRSKAPRSHRNP